MLKCRRRWIKKGSLLLEVLISTALLAVGLLACLRIFSESSYSLQKLRTNEKVVQAMKDDSFGWFLNPASFSVPATDNMSSRDSLFQKSIQATALPRLQDQNNGKNTKNPLMMLNPTSLKFYEITFSIKPGKRESEHERKYYVFHYGPENN